MTQIPTGSWRLRNFVDTHPLNPNNTRQELNP